MRHVLLLALFASLSLAAAQNPPGQNPPGQSPPGQTPPAGQPGQTPPGQADPKADTKAADALQRAEEDRRLNELRVNAQKIQDNGIEVRVKDIARFRGVRGNQLMGFGLVVGLEGTGDSRRIPMAATMLTNALKDFGANIDPSVLNLRNVAVVTVTAELPAFASPGNRIDVTVQSIGDAKSLQGGFLLQTPLNAGDLNKTVYAVSQGPVSIGGFNASANGSSVQKNHVNVGRVPGGAFVEKVPVSQMIFDGHLYLELDDGDLTTAQRLATAIGKKYPAYLAAPIDGGTIDIRLPADVPVIQAMSEIESLTVSADVAAVVVVNERTGTVVLGGNIKLGPAVIVRGGLNVAIVTETVVSQPEPFSQGNTVAVDQSRIDAQEDQAQVGLVGDTATVADLTRLFQVLKVSASDIIAILQALRDQGALKARIKVQ